MWILSGRGWLAAAVVALTLGRVRGAVIDFDQMDFGTFKDGKFVAVLMEGQLGSKVLKWTATENVNIVGVNIAFDGASGGSGGQQIDSTSTTPRFGNQLSTTTTFQPAPDARTEPTGREKRDGGIFNHRQAQTPINFSPLDNKGSGSVNLGEQQAKLQRNVPLYLEVSWTRNDDVNGGIGKSYSRYFAIATGDKYDELVADPRYQNSAPARDEQMPDPNGAGTTSIDNAIEPAPTNKVGSPDNDDGGVPNRPSPTSGVTNQPESDSGGGLAQGAVIAIAVVCGLLGLAAIFFLAFWLRRRQKRRNLNDPAVAASSGGPAGSAPTSELLAEKEAGAAGADIAPHSPYSDDGNHLPATTTAAGPSGVPLVAPIAIPPGQQQQQQHDPLQQARSFTPYSDHHQRAPSLAGTEHTAVTGAPAPAGTGSTAPSPVPGRATPRGLTTPYLVEEGMTEEEIRRLEEEERALDAAIEQAQQQRRNT